MASSRFASVAAAAVTSASMALAVVSPAQAAEGPAQGPKNIIYMIGDGMGYGHIALTNLYETGQSRYLVDGEFGDPNLKELDGEPVQEYERFDRLSMATYPMGGDYDPVKAWGSREYITQGAITDSAAAGTAMATGTKTKNGILGMSHYGMSEENMSERASKVGKAAGVVSSVAYSEATPAAWAAHNMDRDKLPEITHDMLDSDLDVVMAAGHPFYNNDNEPVQTPDYSFISPEDFERLSGQNTDWTYFDEDQDFTDMANGVVEPGEKYWGIAQVESTLQLRRSGQSSAPGSVPYNEVVDLATMTTGALNALNQDEDGFSVMIEGGAIDWTGHSNDPIRDIEETQQFNDSVEAAIDWVEENSSWEETLLIVTADHETGYLSGPNEDSSNRLNAMRGAAGEVPEHGWYSGQHTNQLVPFFFKGAGSEDIKAAIAGTDPVRGDYIDNTLVANLTLNNWWKADTSDAPAPEPEVSASSGSSDGGIFASGFALGAALLASLVGGLVYLVMQTGALTFEPQKLWN